MARSTNRMNEAQPCNAHRPSKHAVWGSNAQVGCLLLMCLGLGGAMLTPSEAWAQEKLTVIEYKNGGLDALWLPYGRRWAIEGVAVTSRGEADVVTIKVKPMTKGGGENTQERCWKRSPEGDTEDAVPRFRTDFEPLPIGNTYDVELNFYSADKSSTLIQPSVSRAYFEAIRRYAANSSLTDNQLIALINDQIINDLGPLFQNGELTHFDVTREGRCTLVMTPPTVTLTPEQRRDILAGVQREALAQLAQGELERLSGEVKKYADANDVDRALYTSLTGKLDGAARRRQAAGLAVADVDALKDGVIRGAAPPNSIVERLEVALIHDSLCPEQRAPGSSPLLTEEECGVFNRIFEFFLEIDGQQQDIERTGPMELQPEGGVAALRDGVEPAAARGEFGRPHQAHVGVGPIELAVEYRGQAAPDEDGLHHQRQEHREPERGNKLHDLSRSAGR